MTDKPAESTTSTGITVLGTETAPFVYFDGVATYGVNHGAMQFELAANIITPLGDGGTKTEAVVTAHLRCSPNALMSLRTIIDRALDLLKQSNETQSAAPEGRLN